MKKYTFFVIMLFIATACDCKFEYELVVVNDSIDKLSIVYQQKDTIFINAGKKAIIQEKTLSHDCKLLNGVRKLDSFEVYKNKKRQNNTDYTNLKNWQISRIQGVDKETEIYYVLTIR